MTHPGFWDTLANLIAPGKRTRLSPYVESAQIFVLTGQYPDPARRHESIATLLKSVDHNLERIAGTWVEFFRQGKGFIPQEYGKDDFLQAYLAYYFSVNVPKVQLVLLDMARHGMLDTPEIHLLDIGVGTGTTAIALLDFLLAWAEVCSLFDEPFPIRQITLTGWDQKQHCLDFARQVLQAYAHTLTERRSGTDGGLEKCVQMCEVAAIGAQWHRHDLADVAEWSETQESQNSNLVVLSNALNEMDPVARRHTEEMLSSLSDGAKIIVIEPGTKVCSRDLMAWRRSFIKTHADFINLGPCGQEFTLLPSVCDQCWNPRKESFHQTLLYRLFREKTGKILGPDRRGYNEFENGLLSWSYIVLGKSPAIRADAERLTKGDAEQRLLRYVGSYAELTTESSPQPLQPVDYDPDKFPGHQAQVRTIRREYLKLCPGSFDECHSAVFERGPGYAVPPLRFGQRFTLAGERRVVNKDGFIKMTHANGTTTIIEALEDICSVGDIPFLSTCGAETQQALDAIAYRLFGFHKLRSFQHEILARVICGHSILGIAATGGGKSECFILPALLFPGVTIVISPLKSLMTDQYEQRIQQRYGLEHLVTYLNGDVPFAERQARLRRMELGYYKLVYMTPEQLSQSWVLDSLHTADQNVGICYLAMDEAHCISQWGHDFRPAYLNIHRRLIERGINPVRIALTATASPDVRRDICEELGLSAEPLARDGDVYIDSSNRPEINLTVRVEPTTNSKAETILEHLRDLVQENKHNIYPGAAIVFMPHTGGNHTNLSASAEAEEGNRSQHPKGNLAGKCSPTVTRFAAWLEKELQCHVAIYHGKMDFDEDTPELEDDNVGAHDNDRLFGDMRGRTRRQEQQRFIGGRDAIMVATKGFGMGIDKPNIRLVIHRTPTTNLEAYAQEAGRAGRDGELATAVLIYSPDSTEEHEKTASQSSIPSDRSIPEFFLKDKYIRSEDVTMIRAMLKTVTRRTTSARIYFTNDEVIAFCDQCPFEWPDFPPRESFGKESSEHTILLNKGHLYDQKTKYVDRILRVLFRIRPDVGSAKKVSLLLDVEANGSELAKVEIRDVQAIIDSNTYFGTLLREKRIKGDEFIGLIKKHDLFPLMRRLERTLSYTVTLLRDVEKLSGHPDKRGHWHSDLLQFQGPWPPRFGPAEGKDTMQQWRSYAGACKRATKTAAYRRAQERGSHKPEIDDWFGWDELPRREGWEVQTGLAFDDDSTFDQYLHAFVGLHDRRQESDWAAYRRLLTDYVGMEEDGVKVRSQRNCLRAVMLGYLKSHEVVNGDNCGSCSRCVPDEHFETDIQVRRSKVVALGAVLEELLATAEASSEMLPVPVQIEALLTAVQIESARGRAIQPYLAGWSARLLQDSPDHRAAMGVRLAAMCNDLLPLMPKDYLRDMSRLEVLCRNTPEAVENFGYLLAKTPATIQAQLEFVAIKGRFALNNNRLEQSVACWERVREALSGIERTSKDATALIREALSALQFLYRPEAATSSRARFTSVVQATARLADTAEDAEQSYALVLPQWDENTCLEEVRKCSSEEWLQPLWGLLLAKFRMGAKVAALLDELTFYFPDAAFDLLHLHGVEPGVHERTETLLVKIAKRLLTSNAYRVRVGAFWVERHRTSSEALSLWIQICLAQNALMEADTAWACLIKQEGNHKGIRTLLKNLNPPISWEHSTLLVCHRLFVILEEYNANHQPNVFEQVDGLTLGNLSRWMKPSQNEFNADLTVAVLRAVRQSRRTPTSYLAPIAREAEALLLARRYAEVEVILQQHPQLTVGRDRHLLAEVLDTARLKNISSEGIAERPVNIQLDEMLSMTSRLFF